MLVITGGVTPPGPKFINQPGVSWPRRPSCKTGSKAPCRNAVCVAQPRREGKGHGTFAAQGESYGKSRSLWHSFGVPLPEN